VCGLAALALASVALLNQRWLLAAGLLGSLSALLLVSGWLLASPGVTQVDALKTGGLAGAAILGLYGLWINDRRRRTEEARHELDRERVSDERFAKAVELLGNDADQVRVGALHVLAGLAHGRPAYTQTVLDVLCAYLRRPFSHPSYEINPADPNRAEVRPSDKGWTEEYGAADRERQVRLTAQRLIADLLPSVGAAELAYYDLDLTGAALEYFELSGRQLGGLTARRARFYGATRLDGILAHRIALFSFAVFSGRADLYAARFDDGLSLFEAQIQGEWRVARASVRRMLDLRTSAPEQQVGTLTFAEGTTFKVDQTAGWATQPAEMTEPARPNAPDPTTANP
jgi:hypothetical protein